MKKFRIQPCTRRELPDMKAWLAARENCVLPAKAPSLRPMVEDGCLLLASTHTSGKQRLLGVAGLDLNSASIRLLVADQSPVLSALLEATERLAVSFGMQHCQLRIAPGEGQSFVERGYRPDSRDTELLQRSLLRRLTPAARKARQLQQELGLPAEYGCRHRLRLQSEPRQLASIGPDVFGREQFLTPPAANALHAMLAAAAADGIELQVVSAFRSVDYQSGLLRNKLDKGLSIEQILEVSAAPGYSEHHSGRAVDFSTPHYPVLEESFAASEAFAWLHRRAAAFGFQLSYPRGNRHGVAYEPWHWYYAA